MNRCHVAFLAVAVLLSACSARGTSTLPTMAAPQLMSLHHRSPPTALKILHDFTGGADGSSPGALFAIGDSLYGATLYGGTGCHPGGCGTIFRIRAGEYSVLYRFSGKVGSEPYSVTVDKDGTIFGTLETGGKPSYACGVSGTAYGCGIVYRLREVNGIYQLETLYRFTGRQGDGGWPMPGLLLRNGVLYGTTLDGGDPVCQCGTVFSLLPSGTGYSERVDYRFTGNGNGGRPNSGLVADRAGSLYGTAPQLFGTGPGSLLFKLTRSGSSYAYSVTYRFVGGSEDWPENSTVIKSDSSFYGVSFGGGSAGCNEGCGSLFKVTGEASRYVGSTIYRFNGGWGGDEPLQPMVADEHGVLFGTADAGAECGNDLQCGVIYSLKPGPTGFGYQVLYRFKPSKSVRFPAPSAPLVLSNGSLFGTSAWGGADRSGSVFALSTK
jgi:uncharacterized repeat protein (TIGR03803 family)